MAEKPPVVVTQAAEMVEISKLKAHPRNPNQGDIGAIMESISVNGFVGAAVAQVSTGHILAGNHRVEAARQLGIKEVPVLWADIDDEAALRFLLVDNRTSELALRDPNMLAELLTELASTSDRGLEGTGYDGDYLDDLLEEVAPKEAAEIADFDEVDLEPKFGHTCPKCGFEFD